MCRLIVIGVEAGKNYVTKKKGDFTFNKILLKTLPTSFRSGREGWDIGWGKSHEYQIHVHVYMI